MWSLCSVLALLREYTQLGIVDKEANISAFVMCFKHSCICAHVCLKAGKIKGRSGSELKHKMQMFPQGG
jgi:hypothetical protein